jgi:hypothetical protein
MECYTLIENAETLIDYISAKLSQTDASEIWIKLTRAEADTILMGLEILESDKV